MGFFDLFKKEKFVAYEFPDADENGQKILKVLTVYLSGVTHEHDGCYPQYYLPKLKCGEQVFLEADANNKYDKFAVNVLDKDNHYIGWLPSGTKDVFDRLLNNETVLARFEALDKFISYDEDGNEYYKDDAPYTGVISYARYAKIKKK